MLHFHCPTCLDPLSPEDDLRCPPCGHVFHYNCLLTWFDNKRASGDPPDCPQCRKVTDTESEYYLLKLYLAAEADIDQQENQESAELQCKLDKKLAEIEILRSYLTEFKIKNEQIKLKNEQLVDTELRSKAEIKITKNKLQRSENETNKLKSKLFKVRNTLQELEVKQGVLKKELCDVKLLLEDTDKERKEAVVKITTLERKLFESENRQQLKYSEKMKSSPKHNNFITKWDTKIFSLDYQQWLNFSTSTALAIVPAFAFFLASLVTFFVFQLFLLGTLQTLYFR